MTGTPSALSLRIKVEKTLWNCDRIPYKVVEKKKKSEVKHEILGSLIDVLL